MADISELRQAAMNASFLEGIITDVEAILDAIAAGGMLDHLPTDENAATLHNSAACLLGIASRRLGEAQAIPGTDLSIVLHVMADDERRRLKAAA